MHARFFDTVHEDELDYESELEGDLELTNYIEEGRMAVVQENKHHAEFMLLWNKFINSIEDRSKCKSIINFPEITFNYLERRNFA